MSTDSILSWRDLPYRTIKRAAALRACSRRNIRGFIERGTLKARKATSDEILLLISLGEIRHVPAEGVWLINLLDIEALFFVPFRIRKRYRRDRKKRRTTARP